MYTYMYRPLTVNCFLLNFLKDLCTVYVPLVIYLYYYNYDLLSNIEATNSLNVSQSIVYNINVIIVYYHCEFVRI